MGEDRFPYVFEFSSRQRHPLDTGQSVAFGGDPADVSLEDVVGGQLLFRLDRDREQWYLTPLLAEAAVAVDRVPVQQQVPLGHLSLIQAGHHVFVFIERDDPNISTNFAASRWLISQLRTATPDLRRTMQYVDTTRPATEPSGS